MTQRWPRSPAASSNNSVAALLAALAELSPPGRARSSSGGGCSSFSAWLRSWGSPRSGPIVAYTIIRPPLDALRPRGGDLVHPGGRCQRPFCGCLHSLGVCNHRDGAGWRMLALPSLILYDHLSASHPAHRGSSGWPGRFLGTTVRREFSGLGPFLPPAPLCRPPLRAGALSLAVPIAWCPLHDGLAMGRRHDKGHIGWSN